MGPSQWAPVLIHASVFEVQPKVGQESCYISQAYTSAGCQIALADGSVPQCRPEHQRNNLVATAASRRGPPQRLVAP